MREIRQQKIFNEWLNDYRALLFKVIKIYTSNSIDRDDLFQEVCLQIYRSIPNFKGTSATSTWLYRIALNTAVKWSTKERKHLNRYHDEAQERINTPQENDELLSEQVVWLYDSIKQFNEIDRSLTLLLLDGLSYKEISEVMGISESNVGVKIHRIKKQLVKHSKRYEYGI